MHQTLFLSEKQLAKRWNKSARTIQGWRLRDQGPAYIKVVGGVLYSIEAVNEYETKHNLTVYTESQTREARS